MGPTLIVCTGCGWPALSDVFTCARCGAPLPVPPPPDYLLAERDETAQPEPVTDPWSQPFSPWHQASPPEPVRHAAPAFDERAFDPTAFDPNAFDPNAFPPNAFQSDAFPPGYDGHGQGPQAWPEHPVGAPAPETWPDHARTDDWHDANRGQPLGSLLGPDMWPTDDGGIDPWERSVADFTPHDRPPVVDDHDHEEDSDAPGAVVGMMPSMSVFTEVSTALSAEAESERRWQAIQQARATQEKPRHTIRNVAIVGSLIIALFAAFLVLQKGAGEPTITATTPVDKMPWRDALAPSGKFRLQLPTASTVSPFSLAGYEGELIVAKLPNGEVRAASFAVNQTVNNQTAFLDEILQLRAEQLFGAIQTTPVKVRWGFAADGTVDLGSKAVAIRATMVGSTLYLIEAESSGTSDRLTQLFERATATFVPTENN